MSQEELMSPQHSAASSPVADRKNGERDQATQRNAAAIRLLDGWLADQSGYDEATWDALKAAMKESRRTSRNLFRD
jgi:hypothetical protein